MNNYDEISLMMCDKDKLVKYIMELRKRDEAMKFKMEDLEDSNNNYSRIISLGSKGTNTFTATMSDYDYITQLQKDVAELKEKIKDIHKISENIFKRD
tara:strand:- start:616 stop:909 length:294 start_codon:yes stop_codon:yes gene_type:complete